MITKNLFKRALAEIKSMHPGITILDSSVETENEGVVWFAFTFRREGVEDMKFECRRHKCIPEGADDFLEINSPGLNYDALMIEAINYIAIHRDAVLQSRKGADTP